MFQCVDASFVMGLLTVDSCYFTANTIDYQHSNRWRICRWGRRCVWYRLSVKGRIETPWMTGRKRVSWWNGSFCLFHLYICYKNHFVLNVLRQGRKSFYRHTLLLCWERCADLTRAAAPTPHTKYECILLSQCMNAFTFARMYVIIIIIILIIIMIMIIMIIVIMLLCVGFFPMVAIVYWFTGRYQGARISGRRYTVDHLSPLQWIPHIDGEVESDFT